MGIFNKNSGWENKNKEGGSHGSSTANEGEGGKLGDARKESSVAYEEDEESGLEMSDGLGSHSQPSDSKGSSTASKAFKFATREARHVYQSKLLVALVLIGATSTLGYFTYKFTREEEQNSFEDQFTSFADEIVDQSLTNAFHSYAVLASFSNSMTSLALFANVTWPLLTVPHFEVRASDYLDLSGAQQVAYAPLVGDHAREAWEAYTVANQGWIQKGIDFEYQRSLEKEQHDEEHPQTATKEGETLPVKETIAPGTNMEGFTVVGKAKPIQEAIWNYAPLTHRPTVEQGKGPHVPIWESYPPPRNSFVVNFNLMSSPEFKALIEKVVETRRPVLSDVVDNFILFGNARTIDPEPKSVLMQPVFESFDPNAPVVGFVTVVIPWNVYFNNVLSNGSKPVVSVLRNSCGASFSYEVNGPSATFLGEGDWHDTSFDDLEVSTNFAGTKDTLSEESLKDLHQVVSVCDYSVHIFPTKELEDSHYTNTPIYITLAVLGVFAFTTLVFLIYDFAVSRRQSKVAAVAKRSGALVTSLFPKEVHDRLFASPLATDAQHQAPKYRLRNFLNDEGNENENQHGGRNRDADAPIADLFPECTVMFCDIAGFTAWSSVREPSQVFVLLETVYSAFDAIANRRRVFKVETIGDSYLAVAGLPTPRRDHASVMVKFARDCLVKMAALGQSLELELGPGTSELSMRFGLHSGPVTAGVLRGEKTRFQLFGDTVNTASRMESTGEKGKIQVSEETAYWLREGSKEHWLTPRETKITAKGKGALQTYWAYPKSATASSVGSGEEVPEDSEQGVNEDLMAVRNTVELCQSIAGRKELDAAQKRSVHWIAEIMIKLLKQIVARRDPTVHATKEKDMFSQEAEGIPMDEMLDIIRLPKFDRKAAKRQMNYKNVKLPEDVLSQLHDFIAQVGLLYHDNPFHNFDHASHVAMSVSKLLSRIVAVEEVDPSRQDGKTFETLRHDKTYGITSDPLTQFAVVFSALIHDADHPGYPNATMVKEQHPLAFKYDNRSVAEQNSLDLCWDILMGSKYKALRACICHNPEETKRFRQLVVNTIIATDISDKQLSQERKARWGIAFAKSGIEKFKEELSSSDLELTDTDEDALEDVNRKATIVIEHLIQASDVSHTMQHWHIFTKWNEKLFAELYKAYLKGKIEKDPAESWYQGELGFFDFYVIPLAKKLKECGVFGVSSSEYLNYAEANRREWEIRGKEVVEQYVAKYAKGLSSN